MIICNKNYPMTMAEEVLKGFPKILKTALQDNKIDYAVRLFNEEKYSDDIKINSWDIIPVITEHLTEENRYNSPELFKCSKHLLDLTSEKSNPEEALLQFVSEIEEAKENAKFVALLNPLFKVTCRIRNKKINSFAWSFNAIQTYLQQCALPEYENLEGKEKLLVDNSPVVSNIIYLYSEIIVFYGNFISKLGQDMSKAIKFVLAKFLIQLLGAPLCYLDMEVHGTIKSNSRNIAEDVVEKVFKTIPNPFLVTEMRFEKQHDELFQPDGLSIANLFYLVCAEQICYEVIPKVYNLRYLFETSVYLVSNLWKDGNTILTEKGLKLAQCFIPPMRNQNISYLNLENYEHSDFCKALTAVIIYSDTEVVRKSALEVFNGYLKSFDTRGAYSIIFRLMDILSHSGLKSFLITFYKDMIYREFHHEECNMSKYFRGPKLFGILRKFCHLDKKEETDLIENYDQIVSSLNFLRYLALRDNNNVTEFWNFKSTLLDIFLEPLKKGLELSRAHYELEIKNINEETHLRKKEVSKVTICGNNVELLEKEEKFEVLNSSLTAFDIMQSLLSRVTELLVN